MKILTTIATAGLLLMILPTATAEPLPDPPGLPDLLSDCPDFLFLAPHESPTDYGLIASWENGFTHEDCHYDEAVGYKSGGCGVGCHKYRVVAQNCRTCEEL